MIDFFSSSLNPATISSSDLSSDEPVLNLIALEAKYVPGTPCIFLIVSKIPAFKPACTEGLVIILVAAANVCCLSC